MSIDNDHGERNPFDLTRDEFNGIRDGFERNVRAVGTAIEQQGIRGIGAASLHNLEELREDILTLRENILERFPNIDSPKKGKVEKDNVYAHGS